MHLSFVCSNSPNSPYLISHNPRMVTVLSRIAWAYILIKLQSLKLRFLIFRVFFRLLLFRFWPCHFKISSLFFLSCVHQLPFSDDRIPKGSLFFSWFIKKFRLARQHFPFLKGDHSKFTNRRRYNNTPRSKSRHVCRIWKWNWPTS